MTYVIYCADILCKINAVSMSLQYLIHSCWYFEISIWSKVTNHGKYNKNDHWQGIDKYTKELTIAIQCKQYSGINKHLKFNGHPVESSFLGRKKHKKGLIIINIPGTISLIGWQPSNSDAGKALTYKKAIFNIECLLPYHTKLLFNHNFSTLCAESNAKTVKKLSIFSFHGFKVAIAHSTDF